MRSSATLEDLGGPWEASWIDLQACTSIDEEWERRAAAFPGATFFASRTFQRAIRTAFPADTDDAAIVVRQGGEMAGLLPLARLPLRQGPITLHETGFIRNAHTLRNNLLMAPDEGAAAALIAAWQSHPGSDTLLLENLPVADGLPSQLVGAARTLGLHADEPTLGRRLDHADLSASFEAYLGTRSGQMRRQLRAKRRDLEAAGRLVIESLEGPALAAAFDEWREVVAASWQATAAGVGTCEGDWVLHNAIAGNGRLWLARLDGRAIAALRMLEDKRTAFVHTMHYDQRLRSLAPGVVLFEAMMRDACQRGLSRVDFNGRTDFFGRWATGTTQHLSVRIYRFGLRSRLAQAVRRTRRWFGRG
jgi:CelD/BcsL family acetyltransferase involved in cellulose biosynthesis